MSGDDRIVLPILGLENLRSVRDKDDSCPNKQILTEVLCDSTQYMNLGFKRCGAEDRTQSSPWFQQAAIVDIISLYP